MNEKIKIINSYKLFFKLINKDIKQFLILVTLLIFETAILISSVLTALPIVDYVVDPTFKNASIISKYIEQILNYLNIEKSFLIFVFIFILLNVLKYFMSTIISVAILNIKYSITYKLNEDLINSIYKAKWKFFADKNIGIILNSLTNVISKITTGISEIALQFSFIFKILSYLAIPLFLDWKITLSTILFVGLLTIPIKLLNKYAYEWGKKNNDYDNQLLKNITENYQAAKIIFGFNLNKFAINKILLSLTNSILYAKKSLISQTVILNGFQPIGLIGASVSFYIFFEDLNSLPEISTIFYSLISATPTLSSFLKGNFSIINLEPALNQYGEILDESKKLRETNYEKTKHLIKFKNSIIFENVNFGYTENNLILEKINFNIKKNDFIVFKGDSGSGKSTLIDLILGLNKPLSGNIKIDDEDLSRINLNSYRDLLGYVPQDPFLFNGTIKENIFLNMDYSDNELEDALIKSNCNFINSLPKNINTQVGDRGLNISGGQRQRICLARALIRKPSILILDEPTSSLDFRSSELIYEILKKLMQQMTIILITHNLNFVDNNMRVFKVIKKSVLTGESL